MLVIRTVGAQGRLRIHALDDRKTCLSYQRHNANWAQQSGSVIDQKKECCKTKDPKTSSNEYNKLRDAVFNSVHRADGKQQRKNEKTSRVSNDVVAHQDGGNNPWRHLSACNLKRDKQRSKSKNDKAQRCCNYSVEHRIGTRLA